MIPRERKKRGGNLDWLAPYFDTTKQIMAGTVWVAMAGTVWVSCLGIAQRDSTTGFNM
jgi:hypothetical protein